MAVLERAARGLGRPPQYSSAPTALDGSEIAARLAGAVRLLKATPGDARASIKQGDLPRACKQIMHGWMWFGKADALADVVGAEHTTILRATDDLRRAEAQYHAARSKP